VMAVHSRISTRTSEGMLAIGHGGAGSRSVGGGSAGIDRVEKPAIRFDIDVDGPCRE